MSDFSVWFLTLTILTVSIPDIYQRACTWFSVPREVFGRPKFSDILGYFASKFSDIFRIFREKIRCKIVTSSYLTLSFHFKLFNPVISWAMGTVW